jgi:hypothetical protein
MGWFPIYDTLHGARGELMVQLRLDSFLFASCSLPLLSLIVQRRESL